MTLVCVGYVLNTAYLQKGCYEVNSKCILKQIFGGIVNKYQ